MRTNDFEIINFNKLGDNRGDLVVLEENVNIPFDIKRVYYMYGTKPEFPRGFHAHKKIKQVAVCVSGSCVVYMDNGVDKTEICLDSPTKGLLIDIYQWHEMHDFTDDCVLMVLASDYYDEADYIRDYEMFIKEIS